MKQFKRLACAFAALPLAACATPNGDYPSLAVRDIERVSGTLEVEPAPEPLPPAPAPATLEQLQQVAQDIRAAHAGFMEQAPQARSTVNAAAGTSRGSEAWARAQVAIAGLEARRSQAMIAMADLDRLYVNAMTEAVAVAEIEEVRQDVNAMVDEQNALIESLLRTLS